MMNITYLGEEIKLPEYLYRYEEMIRYVLKESSFADLSTERTKALLKAELRKAEATWYEFYYSNRRGPDYAYLQEQVTNFGVYRLILFDAHDEELSMDNFIHFHIESLKTEKLLTGLTFEESDLSYIEKYERSRAEKFFEERNIYLKGYEKDRISVNKTMQQLGYKQLREEFLVDSLIESYKKSRN